MKDKIKAIFIGILCLGLFGCITISKSSKLEEQVTELQGVILKKDEGIKNLERLLKEKEKQINEKDAKIKKLRENLEMFGVFEK